MDHREVDDISAEGRAGDQKLIALAYWQATGRYDEPQAGTWWYWAFDRSPKSGQKTPNRTHLSRSTIDLGRLKILGPARGVWVRFPPPAPISERRPRKAESRRCF